jgi:hypothetical protein
VCHCSAWVFAKHPVDVATADLKRRGNQAQHVIGGQTVTLNYDAENRLVTVTGTNLSALFTYNGDGQRVKSVIGNETTHTKHPSPEG